MYFCAGEISAVFAKSLDAINFRLSFTSSKTAIEIFKEVVKFYYDGYLQMIDGSDGVWEIPQARLPLMFSLLKEKSLSKKGLMTAVYKIRKVICKNSDFPGSFVKFVIARLLTHEVSNCSRGNPRTTGCALS